MHDVPDFRAITVEGLAGRVRSGSLSAAAITEAALDRIDRLNPSLNAFVAIDADSARAQAAAIDERIVAGDEVGPLAGVPIGVKDLAAAAGFRTTRGAMHLKDVPVAVEDDTEVARLRAAGCVVIGKTNTPENGWLGDTYNPLFGATLSPWGTGRSSGGSSGGTSAAVASGMVPLGTGSDGGGSIRIPSAVTGMSGFKPSQGRVPSGPSPMGAADLSTVGPLARRIRDVALALDVVAGPAPGDLRSLDQLDRSFRGVCDDPVPPKRLLWCPSVEGSAVDDEVRSVCEGAVDQIRAAGVDAVEHEPFMVESIDVFLMLFFGGMVPRYRDLIGTPAFDDVTLGLQGLVLGTVDRLSVEALETARATAQMLSVRLAETMAGFDALISPVAVGQTPVSKQDGTINGVSTPAWVGNTYPFNVTRRPAGTTCAGFTADGMPVGLQIVGHQLADLRTVELTAWAEDLLGLDPIAP